VFLFLGYQKTEGRLAAARRTAALDRHNLDRLYRTKGLPTMSSMSGWFENETLATFSLGIIFGTIIWDLVFEIRPGLAPRDIDAARSYYRGLQTAPLPVNLVLPLAATHILGFFGVRALAANALPSWLWLGALVAVLAVEIIVALPKERALWREMGDPNTGDAATLEQMRACIRAALYTHLAIAAVLIGLAARV
jgi:hypothetical protein